MKRRRRDKGKMVEDKGPVRQNTKKRKTGRNEWKSGERGKACGEEGVEVTMM